MTRDFHCTIDIDYDFDVPDHVGDDDMFTEHEMEQNLRDELGLGLENIDVNHIDVTLEEL